MIFTFWVCLFGDEKVNKKKKKKNLGKELNLWPDHLVEKAPKSFYHQIFTNKICYTDLSFPLMRHFLPVTQFIMEMVTDLVTNP